MTSSELRHGPWPALAAIHDAFVTAVQKVLSNYKLGDPTSTSTNVGPVISKAAVERIRAQVDDATQKGAVDATPENATFTSAPKEGNYVLLDGLR